MKLYVEKQQQLARLCHVQSMLPLSPFFILFLASNVEAEAEEEEEAVASKASLITAAGGLSQEICSERNHNA